jgi:hypothetical protein
VLGGEYLVGTGRGAKVVEDERERDSERGADSGESDG